MTTPGPTRRTGCCARGGLAAEGTSLLATAVTDKEKERVAGAYGAARLAEIREKAAPHPQLRVYQAGDMI